MILLLVDEDPAVIQHTLGVLKQLGGSHKVHTSSSLRVATDSAANLESLDVLIAPAISSSGEDFFALRDALRSRFPDLHVLFLSDGDTSTLRPKIGDDTVLPRLPDPLALAAWARSVGLDPLAARGTPPAPAMAAAGTSTPSTSTPSACPPRPAPAAVIPVAVAASPAKGAAGGPDEEELPVAGLVSTPAELLGDYKLVRVIASHAETETHEAVQMSIGRTVALVLLKPEFCHDSEALREFRGAVRAKAAVTHPYITPVYEAHEEEGAIFYTRELVEGLNLPQLATTGKKINQRTLIRIVRTTAECLKFLRSHGIKRNDLHPRHIYLGQDAQVRVNNIAALNPTNLCSPAHEIAKVAAAIRPLVSEKLAENDHILPLLGRMEEGRIHSWEDLLTEAVGLEGKVEEAQTYSVSRRTALGAPATSKKTITLIAAAALAISAIAAFIIIPAINKPKPIVAEEMPRIPAGDFIFDQGERRSIPKPFWIDKYEVTIAQYAEFLAALGDGSADAYDHPEQAKLAPGKVGHVPDDWDEYYTAAKLGRSYAGADIDLNCPVFLVDWWDAHAYAKWKGHRLPTEEEWSKAARGPDGNVYPWGDNLDFSKFNSSEKRDQFPSWSPVDAMPEDISPYGVIATCGNVSEWTATTDTHPEFFDRHVPIVRGGNFASPADRYALTDRRHALSAEDRSIYTGFRTVSDSDPTL